MLPTAGVLEAARVGWWSEGTAVDIALGFNTVALFGWGLWEARTAGRDWVAACRVGCVDMAIGLFIVAANALSEEDCDQLPATSLTATAIGV